MLERLGIQNSSSFCKNLFSFEFEGRFFLFFAFIGLVFYLESFGVCYIMLWCYHLRKSHFNFGGKLEFRSYDLITAVLHTALCSYAVLCYNKPQKVMEKFGLPQKSPQRLQWFLFIAFIFHPSIRSLSKS